MIALPGFRQARFGMFVHWGVYALQRNGEWVMNADGISPADGTPALFLSPDARGGRILGWKRLEDSVEWTFHIERGGRFRPAFVFNNPESLNCYGRRLEMTVAGQTLRASVPMSGRHHRYDTYRMDGSFELEPGLHTLAIKPYVLDPGILMNLRAAILTRVG